MINGNYVYLGKTKQRSSGIIYEADLGDIMTWKPIDFEGTIALDKPLYEHLDQYLYEREGVLGKCIVHSIHLVGESQSSQSIFHMKLAEALEFFEKRIRQVALDPNQSPTMKDFHRSLSLINKGLWKYVETLESCVIELFQQIEQIGLEKWHHEIPSVVNSIKVLLMHRMEDMSWAIQRMEKLLWFYHKICSPNPIIHSMKRILPWSFLLDHRLILNLNRSKKFLTFRHKKFMDRVHEYNKLYEKIEVSLQKFRQYHVFNTLESNEQESFKKVYQLLKLWELNQSTQSIPKQKIVRAVRQVQGEDKIYQSFEDYYRALKHVLFHQARLLKLGPQNLWKEASGKTLILELISNHRVEIHTLGATVLKYRDFLLRNDPNPYIRSRWGFSEWIVGPEPTLSKRIVRLAFDIEALDSLYVKLRSSIEKELLDENKRFEQISEKIEDSLHELSQPLTTRPMMKRHIDFITNALGDLDELGSFNRAIMDYVGGVLSRILRVDWKYNVAFEIPKFKDVYLIHQGLLGHVEDRQHINRLNQFKHIIQEIEGWAQKKVTQRHIHEIEHDMSDIKVLLQEFLATVQRLLPIEKKVDTDLQRQEIRKDIQHKLLEYRYQFGQFFYHLSQNESEERSLRTQFLFVNQYFEAVESRLNE